jgi:hypothetical protein
MNGKGSGRRPSSISKREADENWERTFSGTVKEDRQKLSLPAEHVQKNEESFHVGTITPVLGS